VTAAEVRESVTAHLADHPGLTACELARVLGVPGGGTHVRTVLLGMERDRKVTCETVAAGVRGPRPASLWSLAGDPR
jgi:hypothetical protein